MSWFDAAGIANLAKSALKEAQKTIDKALDIQEEEQKKIDADPSNDDFFSTWGIGEQENSERTGKKPMQNSIWGSFTGSFFDDQKQRDSKVGRSGLKSSTSLQDGVGRAEKAEISVPPRSLSNNFGDRSGAAIEDEPKYSNLVDLSEPRSKDADPGYSGFSRSESYEPFGELDSLSLGESSDTLHDEAFSRSQLVVELENVDARRESSDASERTTNTDDATESDNLRATAIERRDLNRISTISNMSTGSDKKSSESVEILGSRSSTGTDCTTTPESEVNSISESASSSAVGARVNSESVEVLPDSSVTSPSSVEILGDWKSEPVSPNTPNSPNVSPVERDNSSTPFAERVGTVTPAIVREAITPCSDISPYHQSPMDEEAKTLLSLSPFPDGLDAIATSGVSPEYSEPKDAGASPASVEVIPEVDESEEPSVAEDSYTSASESTLLTVMETVQMIQTSDNKTKPLEQAEKKLNVHESCPDGRQTVPGSNLENQFNPSVDLSSEKRDASVDSLLAPITTQPVRKSENLEIVNKISDFDAFDPLKCATIEPPDPDTFRESIDQLQRTDSEQPLTLNDSSCEGTLVETSSEENATLICEAEPKHVEATLTASSYVQNMLADAMAEKSEILELVQRENSPISSESRSDLVKIGSDQTSGHTSGDELETTTSSDIEIISSPNGDSSSTQSRQSPTKLHAAKNSDLLARTLNKVRGHSRELSEISVGSDDANVEVEKLLKRIQEMTEILEARESKLVDVSRMNMELHEQNNRLKSQLDNVRKHAEEKQDLGQITDDYTQRLCALERKFQQAIRERDTSRKQLDQLKREAATRMSPRELTSINAEKDEIIKELRDEGEKLSRQQLQHSNIIKKLRSKEKESDALVKQQREQIDEQSSELERLKRSLHAKEDVERSQIEAVHALTARTKKQEREVSSLQEKLDDALQKLDTYKKSLDAAKTELTETKQNLSIAEEELKEAVENAGESSQLSAQVRDLKSRMRGAEESHVRREATLRREINELLKRLESSEARNEELSESLSTATRPLLRQLEQLQSNLSYKTESFAKQEKSMAEKIIELQTKLDTLVEMDRTLREENVAAKTKIASLEAKLNAKQTELDDLRRSRDEARSVNEKLSEEKKRYQKMLDGLEQARTNEVKELKREISSLEHKLAVEKAATDAEKRKNNLAAEQQQNAEDELRLSPTLSIGRDSVSSFSSVWPAFNDSMFDSGSGRFANVYDSVRVGANSTSMIENLQAQLKQRDGEVQQLQWEISRRNAERDALNAELSHLTGKVETLGNKLVEIESVNENLNDVQTKYDALLQMYGEKVEENEELRLDLEDVKEMFKSQIDQLLKRNA